MSIYCPASTILAPRNADRVPGVIIVEGVMVRPVNAMDEQSQLHRLALVQVCTELELINI